MFCGEIVMGKSRRAGCLNGKARSQIIVVYMSEAPVVML